MPILYIVCYLSKVRKMFENILVYRPSYRHNRKIFFYRGLDHVYLRLATFREIFFHHIVLIRKLYLFWIEAGNNIAYSVELD